MPDQEQHTITVFVENEAGSNIKHHYNEATFTVERTEQVAAHYPFPYGFIPGTVAPDGDAADCFVITDSELRSGDRLQCRPLALLEQTEAGDTDHNVIAIPVGEPLPDLATASAKIADFARAFRRHDSVEVTIGDLCDVTHAVAYISSCTQVYRRSIGT